MVLNWIWVAFFIVAFVIALVKLVFWGDFEVFPAMMDSTFASSKTAFEISLGLTGVLSLWLGIMKIGEKGGVVNVLARLLSPIFTKLFPDIPKGHPVTGSIFMNIAANMLGLDNAATPLGLKAMEQLKEIEDGRLKTEKEQGRISDSQMKEMSVTATNPMIMFLVPDADTHLNHGVSCPDGCCPAYGYLYPHSAGNILLDAGRHHHHELLPEDQPAEPHHPAHPGWSCPRGGLRHLGFRTDGLDIDEQGEHLIGQYHADGDYHRLHPGWREKEGKRV